MKLSNDAVYGMFLELPESAGKAAMTQSGTAPTMQDQARQGVNASPLDRITSQAATIAHDIGWDDVMGKVDVDARMQHLH
jgi:hypothetical protein